MANIDAMKILGSLLSSGALSRGSGSNVLGSVIGALTGGSRSSSAPSGGCGLGDLVGGMLGGGRSQGGGGLGDLLGGVLGGAGGSQSSGGGLGDLFGMAMKQFGAARSGSPQAAATEMPRGADPRQMQQQAEVMIRAMINAAKSDGTVDREEQQKIVGQLGEVTQDEIDFVQRELAASLDVAPVCPWVVCETASDCFCLGGRSPVVSTPARPYSPRLTKVPYFDVLAAWILSASSRNAVHLSW